MASYNTLFNEILNLFLLFTNDKNKIISAMKDVLKNYESIKLDVLLTKTNHFLKFDLITLLRYSYENDYLYSNFLKNIEYINVKEFLKIIF